MRAIEDKRRFIRVPLVADIDVIDNSLGETVGYQTQNIGPGGLFIESDLLFEVGEVIWLSFALPGIAMAMQTRGKIAWVHKYTNENDPTDRPGMGIEFLDLNDSERAALGSYLKVENLV